jgi:hypothetical protein
MRRKREPRPLTTGAAISHDNDDDMRGGTRALFLHRRQPSVKCARARPLRAGARRATE